ncbi:TetR/AcrR family transcriptional regulator [Paenibacillus bovis]|uniref:TetR family transcriptional regulator n=1 Tax=Paenibacillus bovis TaxID=1616788 RepID=A0A172ZE32_9BACL|nr:TetR/AcrR family transcriptional regulator [Paenibacillus bovis]ANF95906.1 TetR family transcriptional regulator [Paenibacillus bovis]
MNKSWHQQVKNQHREEIITAGRELFLQRNFPDVNIREVCQLAGISRVTFYKHFSSLDELVFEVQMSIMQQMTDYITAPSSQSGSGRQQLEKILYRWVDYAKSYPRQLRFITLFDLYYDSGTASPELKQQYEQFVNAEGRQGFLQSILEQGIADGSLASELNPVHSGFRIFQTLMGLLQRMSMTCLPDYGTAVTYDDIVMPVVQMLIDTISPH